MTGDVEGEVFGRYRLLEVLRWGGMGTVYRARDTVMTREVAVKVIPGEPEYQDRFRREVSVAARLNNPNIIPVYEAGEIDGRLYLVMPLVDGIDLQTLLHRDGPMSPELAVRVVEQAAAALEAGHTCGLVHGDVKPANILVVGGEFVYLLDFGAAVDSSGPADPHHDISALTGVLYECLTGQPADAGGHSGLPAGFDAVIARGMADDPDDRYQSARELAVAAREALTAATTAEPADETEFGRYRLFELLGTGGMGSVYRAHDTLLGRDVAVKVLRPELATEPGYQERFRREAYAAGRLANPHIIPIYEAGEINGRLYLAMPIVDGVDLHHLLEQAGPMSPQQAVRVVEQVAVALDAAHKSGLVHRDVKPSNLLTVGGEFVYLIDFGLVHEATATRLTRTDIAPGSPAYMAPERFKAGTIADARADVYSLACVLYECLIGRPPYAGGGVEGLTAAHLFDEPPKPSSADPAMPAGFDEVIARGMAKQPDDRYQSASELAVAARAALTTKPATPSVVPDALHSTQDARTIPSPSRSRRRALGFGALAAVAVLIAGAAFLGLTGRFPFHSGDAPTQIVLPFTGLDGPLGVAVDINRNVYVTDTGNNRVLKLAADSTTQTVEPFVDLNHPGGIAVDEQGNLAITEPANNRVLELAAGSTDQTALPLNDLAEPAGVALYTRNRGTDRIVVSDSGHDRVLALSGANSGQRELPFTGLNDPSGVAVGSDGGLFVIDRENERILKLPWTASVATVLPYAVGHPDFVAVDAAGDLYVTDSHANRVTKLRKDTTASITLPFNGLKGPQGVAVDSEGNVYVADAGNNRVLKLPPN